MPWLKLKLKTTPNYAELYEELMLATGASSVTTEDAEDNPIFEPDLGTHPLWADTHITGLYDAETDMEHVKSQLYLGLQTAEPQVTKPDLHVEILEDKDWQRAWMEHFHPIQFGSRLWICPSWRQPPKPEATNLMLDPGLAFGTGTHPTTSLCLKWLDSLALEDLHVIDYGCGSGILGIAALLLGAQHMDGVDIDAQALTATFANAEKNHVRDKVSAYKPEEFHEKYPSIQADIVIANILTQPLIKLAPTLLGLCKTGGRIALSGLLARQVDEVKQAYQAQLKFDVVEIEGDWARISGVKTD